jgi:hypothetical protein
MRKILAISLFCCLAATAALADYVVVMKDGRRFQARAKWTIVEGKAIVELTNGTRLQIDPALIDAAESEIATRSGLGDAKVLEMGPQSSAATRKQQPSLGSIAAIRKQQASSTPPPLTPAPARIAGAPEPAAIAGTVDSGIAEKFHAAYENVSLFERKLTLSEQGRLRIDVMADTEDQVFKAISATAFVFSNVPSPYSGVDLFLRTVNGGSAGRFQMDREQARGLADKKIEWYDYYVRNVIF